MSSTETKIRGAFIAVPSLLLTGFSVYQKIKGGPYADTILWGVCVAASVMLGDWLGKLAYRGGRRFQGMFTSRNSTQNPKNVQRREIEKG